MLQHNSEHVDIYVRVVVAVLSGFQNTASFRRFPSSFGLEKCWQVRSKKPKKGKKKAMSKSVKREMPLKSRKAKKKEGKDKKSKKATACTPIPSGVLIKSCQSHVAVNKSPDFWLSLLHS